MPRTAKPITTPAHSRESSFLSLLSGWVQQGVENFFATQRILVDLAVRQNTNALNLMRERLADPVYCPVALLSELAGEGMTNFIQGQKLLLGLAQREYEIFAGGVKDRVGDYAPAVAMTDLVQRSFDTFVEMQQEFLELATKQTHTWLTAVKAGKMYDTEGLVDLAREGMDTFVRAQKKFLDVIAEETSKATSGNGVARKVKKAELMELAKEATEAFVDAQKKLMDVAGRQMNANLKAGGRALNMLSPMPFAPFQELTRQGVKTFVDAEKELIDTVIQRGKPQKKTTMKAHRRGRRPGRTIKVEAAAAHAG